MYAYALVSDPNVRSHRPNLDKPKFHILIGPGLSNGTVGCCPHLLYTRVRVAKSVTNNAYFYRIVNSNLINNKKYDIFYITKFGKLIIFRKKKKRLLI